MATKHEGPVQKISDLLFFDNLALYYLVERCPVPVMGRVFNSADARLTGSMLGVMNPQQRTLTHASMVKENDGIEELNREALAALLILANDLCARGLVRKEGLHFFGTPANQALQP
ncbi:MAG: hypothetical protein H7A21_07155 [Spirochaetales bacterium]|nr:hypothetical protein [Leptospiraceae bacterium]MCP5481191.1 hypothetical protein [Spirochaetales bacterium]